MKWANTLKILWITFSFNGYEFNLRDFVCCASVLMVHQTCTKNSWLHLKLSKAVFSWLFDPIFSRIYIEFRYPLDTAGILNVLCMLIFVLRPLGICRKVHVNFTIQSKCSSSWTKKPFIEHVIIRSSPSQMFFKIDILKNFAILARKHLCWSFLLIKLQAVWLQRRYFLVNNAKLLSSAIFNKTPLVAALDYSLFYTM